MPSLGFTSQKTLRKCRNKADLDNQPYNRLHSLQQGNWVIERNAAGEEAASMKRGDAEYQRTSRRDMRCDRTPQGSIERGEQSDHQKISDQTASRLIAITGQRIQKDGTTDGCTTSTGCKVC
jgi:hypothetical protein